MNTDLHTTKGNVSCHRMYDEYIDYPSIEWDKGLQATSKSECPAPADQIPYFRIGAAIYRQVAGILQDMRGERNYLSNVKLDWGMMRTAIVTPLRTALFGCIVRGSDSRKAVWRSSMTWVRVGGSFTVIRPKVTRRSTIFNSANSRNISV